jgi:hypothetical protein
MGCWRPDIHTQPSHIGESDLVRHTQYPQHPALHTAVVVRIGATALIRHIHRTAPAAPAVTPDVITKTRLLHATGQASNPCMSQRNARLEDQDGSAYLIERGAAAICRPALMRMMMGSWLAQCGPTEPHASVPPTNSAAECCTAARGLKAV